MGWRCVCVYQLAKSLCFDKDFVLAYSCPLLSESLNNLIKSLSKSGGGIFHFTWETCLIEAKKTQKNSNFHLIVSLE